MFLRKIRHLAILYRYVEVYPRPAQLQTRNVFISASKLCDEKKEPQEMIVHGSFEDIENKNKQTYLDMIKIFVNRDHVYRRGHVEFIYAALKNMESFGVHKDLEVYRALIDVLPKGRFVATNMMQVEFMHYPKQQQCMIDLLEQMEDNGVIPDYEIEDLLTNIFGGKAYPLRKFWRMMYWMPKFKNLTPWPLPDSLPESIYELAKLAIERISSADIQTKVTTYQSKDVEDSIEDTWIVSAQSPIQKRLLREHDIKEPVYIEGAFRVWLRGKPVNYFIMRANPKPVEIEPEDSDDVSNLRIPFFNLYPPFKKELKVLPSVHEQEDGVILSVCATGTSSKDSLLSWVRLLEKDDNPSLAHVPIVFTLKSGSKEIVTVSKGDEKTELIN